MVDYSHWQHCLNDILSCLSADDAVGLRLLALSALAPDRALLCGVPDSFWKARIERKLLPLIRDKLALHFPAQAPALAQQIELRIGAGAEALSPSAAKPTAGRDSRRRRVGGARQTELPLSGDDRGGAAISSLLEARYTFANFQEGPCNRMALQLAQQVAAEPGTRFNPLVLVGRAGHGKTHLLHAIGRQVRDTLGLNSVYTTAESFANEIWDGIRLKQMSRIRERYRHAELLLLDGLEFLQVTPKAQQELCHTLDALHTQGRQIVFASDRYPHDLDKFAAPLRSRLEAGLIAELGDMEPETRLKLVQTRARHDGIELPEGAARLLSTRIKDSPRKLEGALLRVGAYAALLEQPITDAFVEQMARPFLDEEPAAAPTPLLSAEKILARVCEHFGLTVAALGARSRDRRVVQARRTAIHFLRRSGGLSYPEIGTLLGGRTHSTIMHAEGKFAEELAREPLLRKFVETLHAELIA